MKTEDSGKMEDQEFVFDELRFKKQLSFSFSLFLIFALTYFFAAVVTTKELKHVAAIDIMGLPMAFYLGLLVFVVGVIVVRLYLIKTLKGWR